NNTYQRTPVPDMQEQYPTEYRIAADGLKIINANLKVYFPKDRKSTRLNSSHVSISYSVFFLKKKNHSYALSLSFVFVIFIWIFVCHSVPSFIFLLCFLSLSLFLLLPLPI